MEYHAVINPLSGMSYISSFRGHRHVPDILVEDRETSLWEDLEMMILTLTMATWKRTVGHRILWV